MSAKSPAISAVLRSLLFLLLGGMLYAQWHERIGRFAFFEQLDPPGADPHRTRHLRDIYILVYGSLGLLLGVIAAVGAHLRQAVATVLMAAVAFLVLRYRGLPELFNPSSEEGFYGAPTILLCATAVVGVVGVRRFSLARRRAPHGL
jgi:hypothetical protein